MDILKVRPGPDSSLPCGSASPAPPARHTREGTREATPGAVPSGYSGCPGSDYQNLIHV